MGLLSDKEKAGLAPACGSVSPTPAPARALSRDMFTRILRAEVQKQGEARMNALGDEYGRRNDLSRRRFFQTAAGMATAFVAMNEVYGPLFDVTKAEAATPAMAQERAAGLKDQFIMDMHTPFLRAATRILTFVNMRAAVGKAGWNKQLADKEHTIEDVKLNNYKKEMFLDSDTKISLISSTK